MFKSHVVEKLGVSGTKLEGIKNIIFDLGGVLISLNYNETIEQFNKLGFVDFERIYIQIKQNRIFDLLETGKIPAQVFRNELRKFHNHLSDRAIDHAWCTMIGDMPAVNISLLKYVRSRYRTFLLSNTNIIHIDYFIKYLHKTFGYDPLPEMFEHTYYSHEIGERKPLPESFNAVIRDAGINASETMFIDDLKANIEGARAVGLLAYHLENEEITNVFEIQTEFI